MRNQNIDEALEPGQKSKRVGRLGDTALRLLGSYPVLGIILFVFVVSFPPLEITTAVNLGVHMLQHILIAVSGVLIGYPIYKSGRLDKYKSAKLGLAGFLVIAPILIFWHLPMFWDAAVQNLYVHITEHFCFLVVGILIGMTIPMLPDNFKLLLLALAVSAHMFYGFALYVINTPIYPLYPVNQQQILGISLFAPSPIYFVGYLYFSLSRQSRKLEALENPVVQTRKSNRAGRYITPTLSVILIATLVAYFCVTGAMIVGSSNNYSKQVSTVYIDESPVYWQYSPQVINVVLGVNNTVVWVSHSFTYDTVTSANGAFDSGPIAPGSSFSYTFTQAGTYNYYCIYHVWMKGTIIVSSS